MGHQLESLFRAQCGPWLVGLMCLLATACTKAEPELPTPPPRPSTPPNIILISLDTVRADHMACYGYGVANTPSLDAFAEKATLWTKAYATAPWTLPSHVSMLTGKYPFAHGAHTFEIKQPGRNVSPLDLEVTTLPEVLQQHGYRTGGFIANKHFLSERFQANQGFDTYHVFKTPTKMATATDVNTKAQAWLESEDERPYFLFLNYMDAHRPYRSTERPGLFDFPVGTDSPRILSRLMEPILSRAGEDHSEELHQLRAQYDTAIANLDEDLGAWFALLEERGELDDALIIVTSDHGEYFGEHDLLEHSKDVYQEALLVPLIIKMPQQAEGLTIDTEISIAAIPSMVMTRLPQELADAVASELQPLRLGDAVVAENYYSRSRDLFDRPWGDRFHRIRRTLIEDGWKFIHGTDGSAELYYLPDDSKEQNDRAAAEPERVLSMRAKLEQSLTEIRTTDLGDSPEYTEEELKILDELGY